MFDYAAQAEHYQNQYSEANEMAFQSRVSWVEYEIQEIQENIPAVYVTLLPESTEVSAVFLCVVTPDNMPTALSYIRGREFEEHKFGDKVIFQSYVVGIGSLNILVDKKLNQIKLTFNT